MAYMFNLKDRYPSLKKDYEAYETKHSEESSQNGVALPTINSFGSSSKF